MQVHSETAHMAPSFAPVRERVFNRNIQGARGVFALMVLLYHIHNSHLDAPDWTMQGVGGFVLLTLQFAVELFFCISGFVIAGTLRRAKSPVQFFQDRAIRILPVLWATMPVVLVMEYTAGFTSVRGVPHLTFAWYLLANLFCFPTIVSSVPLFHLAAWSLSYEMAFYAVCSFGWALRRRGYKPWPAGIAGAVLLFLHPRGLFFLVGVLVAEGIADRWCPVWAKRMPLLWLAVSLAAWGAIWRLNGDLLDFSAMGWWDDWRLPLAVVAVVAAVPFFQGLADGRGGLDRLLGNRLVQFLGKISYSFYLWQFIVLAITKRVFIESGLAAQAGMLAQPLLLIIVLPPVLIISACSQILLEKHVSAWLRRRLHHPMGWILQKNV